MSNLKEEILYLGTIFREIKYSNIVGNLQYTIFYHCHIFRWTMIDYLCTNRRGAWFGKSGRAEMCRAKQMGHWRSTFTLSYRRNVLLQSLLSFLTLKARSLYRASWKNYVQLSIDRSLIITYAECFVSVCYIQ